MSKTYKYSGLTPELYQRLVNEHAALRKVHKKGSYKQFFQDAKQCSELQARIIYQAFNSAVVERARYRQRLSRGWKVSFLTNYSTTFEITYLYITQEVKPFDQFWIKPTQDCQNTYSNDSRKKWKAYARNTLTT